MWVNNLIFLSIITWYDIQIIFNIIPDYYLLKWMCSNSRKYSWVQDLGESVVYEQFEGRFYNDRRDQNHRDLLDSDSNMSSLCESLLLSALVE